MKGFAPLVLGIIGTFVFSWAGLAWVPNLQIGRLDPQSDEEGGDIYPWPTSGMAERGRHIYASNGCMYCHTQQVRADYASADIDRKFGDRRSAPRDYVFARPVLLGKMRMGPDLANVGHRQPPQEGAAPAASPAAGAPPGASPASAGANSPPPGGSPAPPATAASSSPPPAGSPAAAAAPPPPAAGPPSPAAPAGAASAPPAASAAPAGAASPAPNASAAPGQPPPNAPVAGAANPTATSPAATAATSTEATTGPNGEPLPYTAAWHHKHLYSPRSINLDSIMPAYRFLYEKRRVEGQYAADALKLTGDDAPPAGYEIVPSYDAKCLVAYLMSLDQTHPLKEVKSIAPPSPAAPAKGAK